MVLWGFYLGIRYLFVPLLEIQGEKEQWIASEFDKHRVKMFHEMFINITREDQKEPFIHISSLNLFCLNDSIYLLRWILFLLGILRDVN